MSRWDDISDIDTNDPGSPNPSSPHNDGRGTDRSEKSAPERSERK